MDNIFVVTPEASLIDIHDAMSLRLERIRALSMVAHGDGKDGDYDNTSPDNRVAYMGTIHALAEEVSTLLQAYDERTQRAGKVSNIRQIK